MRDTGIAFHPGVAAWFASRFEAPTEVQARSWPRIATGEHLVITAPTGSGKTLTAFLWALNAFATGASLPGATRVLYVSPLKALNNDIRRNLTEPLRQLRDVFDDRGEVFPNVRAATRSGDTPQGERQRLLRRPPEILITTPESLLLLLTTTRGRQALSTVETVIVDEIHSVVENRRGASLMTSLERLVEIAGEFQRIALSATVRPIEAVARFVGGSDANDQPRAVGTVRAETDKKIELAVRFPEAARYAAENGKKVWEPLSDVFKDVIDANRSTLFFANSRRLTEKITLKLNDDAVSPIAYAHHGSLSREVRAEVERRFKDGELKAIVATNSLEMGIDIGDLDEVVLVQSPPSLAASLQRIGRAGHNVGDTSRGSLFPTHARDFLEAAAIANAVQARDIEPLTAISNPLDVLAQVLVSMTASETRTVEEAYRTIRRAGPYASLDRDQFDLVVEMLAGRYAGTRIRDLQPRIAFDRIRDTLKARKSAVFALYNAGGTIPDRGYFKLRHAESGALIGELDEEFVWEATIGQTFTLGTQNWHIERITHNDVLVKSAQAKSTAPPFWRAENIDRSFYFSQRVGDFLEFANGLLAAGAGEELERHLREDLAFEAIAAEELRDYLARQREASGRDLPHRHHLAVEHIRAGPGGYAGPDRNQQVVLHTSWGGRVNRPIALAMEAAWRQRFDTEADIHADNYAIVAQVQEGVDASALLSLVTPDNFEALLRQSLEGSGFFGARFRECAGRALLLTRQRFNQRMPLWLTRMQAKKLLTAIRSLHNFPILLETWRACLGDEFDMPAAREALADLETGAIATSIIEVSAPTPFAAGIAFDQVSRYMYADDTPERRAPSALSEDLIRQAVHDQRLRPSIAPGAIADFESKAQRTAAGYAPQDADDLAEWVKERVLIPEAEFSSLVANVGETMPDEIIRIARGTNFMRADSPRAPRPNAPFLRGVPPRAPTWFVHAEDAAHIEHVLFGAPGAQDERDDPHPRDAMQLFTEFIRFYGPRTRDELRALFPVEPGALDTILATLVDSEILVEGPLVQGSDASHFCDAENLETLIRFQRAARRAMVEPQPVRKLPAFIAAWQRVGAEASESRLLDVAEQLRGFIAPLPFWLEDAWRSRLTGFEPEMLSSASANYGLTWRGAGRERITFGFDDELEVLAPAAPEAPAIMALFADPAARYTFAQLMDASGMDADAFNALFWKAVWAGQVVSDSVLPLKLGAAQRFRLAGTAPNRPQAASASDRHRARQRARARAGRVAQGWPGNWMLVSADPPSEDAVESPSPSPPNPIKTLEAAKDLSRVLLDRYGIVNRDIAAREGGVFRWRDLFRALRVMELSGEVVAGLFFEGLAGPQFALPGATRELGRLKTDRQASFWVNAVDPIAPTGLGLDWKALPQRRAQNHLGFHAGELAFVVENSGKRLRIHLEPDDPGLDALAIHLPPILRARRRVVIETINDLPARQSPYLEALGRHLDLVHDHRGVYVQRRI